MKKKILLIFIALVCAITCAFGFAACGDKKDGGGHVHFYCIQSDETAHWYECINDGCDNKIIDKDEHKDNDGDGSCDICGRYCAKDDNQNNNDDIHKHSLRFVEAEPADCQTAGNIAYYVCDGCGKLFEDEDGAKEIVDQSSANISPKGHKLTLIDAKTPDCKESGNIAYYVCDVCEIWFADKDAASEIFDHDSVLTGYSHKYVDNNCSVCGAVKPTEGLEYRLTGSGVYGCCGIGTATETDIVIADIYNGKKVTFITEKAFSGCKTLSSVTIPDSVQEIGDNAFSRCTALSNVVFPDSLNYIGSEAFEKCSNLTSIVIPDDVTSIGYSTFANCNNLSSVDLGNGITSIGARAFIDCNALTSIKIPDGVTSIGHSAFGDCGNLVSVELGKGLASVEESIFYGCTALEDVIIPDSLKAIERRMFGNCTSLLSISIPDSVTSIGEGAFSYCTSLKNVTIGTGVVSIGNMAFDDCENLSDVILPDSVKSIGDSAFSGCRSLTNIAIPAGLTSIGEYAFYACANLKSITVDENNTEYCSQDGILYDKAKTQFIHIPHNVSGSVTIPGSVSAIYENAFSNCSDLSSVTIENGVTSIGNRAFESCNSLTNVIIPDSVETINEWTFNGRNTTTIYCEASNKPNGWAEYWNGNHQVVWNYKYNDVADDGYIYTVVGDIRYSIKDDKACIVNQLNTSVSELIIPNSVTYKGSTYPVTSVATWAFDYCDSLISITIPDSVTSVRDNFYLFYDNHIEFLSAPSIVLSYIYKSSLMTIKTVEITGGDSIEDNAFYGCENLTSVTVSDSVKTIGKSAFSGCSSLASVTLGSGLTSIGANAFYGCTNLKEVDIKDIAKWCAVSCDANPFTYAEKLYVDGELVRDLVIPDGVTSIEQGAFRNLGCLTSVTIPNSVSHIGYWVFDDCANIIQTENGVKYVDKWIIGCDENETEVALRDDTQGIADGGLARCANSSLTLPDGLKYIGNWAFGDSTNLESITIPDSVISFGWSAFSDCSSLINVKIPDGVASISDSMFRGCTNLKSVTIPDSVISIGENAFWECKSLTSITIPYGVTSIGYGTFGNCEALASIVIPDGVTFIGDYAFGSCKNIENVTMPATLISYVPKTSLKNVVITSGVAIEENAFKGCEKLTDLTIADSVTSIGEGAFDGCPVETATIPAFAASYIRKNNLKTVVITSGDSIDEMAFANCNGLISITIPDSITSIGSSAFEGCSSLQYNEYDNALYLGNESNKYVVIVKVKTIGITSCTINEKTKVIYYNVFNGCGGLTSITIPDGVTSIGGNAFYGCRALTSITIPDSVTSIDYGAFMYCNKLTSITIPDSVISIGYDAFRGCRGLTSIIIPDSVTSIGGSAFKDCIGLRSVTISNGVTSISYDTFSGCSALTSITIPDSVTSIGSGAFSGCSKLLQTENGAQYVDNWIIDCDTSETQVSLREDTKGIAEGAFEDCHGLTSITIPDSVIFIGNNAFKGCSGLKSIVIPDGVTSIGNYAFERCSSLTSATIGISVTSIGYNAFSGCSSLETITVDKGNTKYYSEGNCIIEKESKMLVIGCKNSVIPNNVTSIGGDAFWECSGLTSIIIPDSVTSIGKYAFCRCSGLTNITISDNVTAIGNWAFSGCSGLTSITIGNGVIYIGKYAFENCSKLTNITFNGTMDEWFAIEKDDGWFTGTCTTHCTDGDMTEIFNR